jgi:hypothetical protein
VISQLSADGVPAEAMALKAELTEMLPFRLVGSRIAEAAACCMSTCPALAKSLSPCRPRFRPPGLVTGPATDLGPPRWADTPNSTTSWPIALEQWLVPPLGL